MRRFADERLEEIYHYRSAAGLPPDLCAAAHRTARLLVASRALMTLGLFADAISLGNGRKAVPLLRHWRVSFTWTEGEGPFELMLERF